MTRQGSAPFGAVALDELDRAILRLLREDGRRSNAAIARAVGVSQPTVRQRIDRLIGAGVAHVTVRINPAAIGYPVDAVVDIKVSGRNLRDVGEQIAAMENVAYVGYLSGAHDIQVEAFLRDNDDLFRFVTEELMPIDGVASVETAMVMRTEKFNYKWEGEAVGSTTEPATGHPAEYAGHARVKLAGSQGAGGTA